MALKRIRTTSSSSISVGNCEVVVESNNFTSKCNPHSVELTVSKNSKITVSVVKDGNGEIQKAGCDTRAHKTEDILEEASPEDRYCFVLANPKDVIGRSKSLLQEVLNIYMKELPAMNYAANTGKQSNFLERCVLNGKYSTLLLKSNSVDDAGKVIAAITFQIIPADTQYAEIPLAAVSSIHQCKGIGHLLYMELKKRLESVGLCTIICWGDQESEGFWFKQGFVSVADVDTKGKARKLPVKAGIRRALSFPGGSTFMVAHLNTISVNPPDTLNRCILIKHTGKSFLADANKIQDVEESYYTAIASKERTPETETSLPDVLVKDGTSLNINKLDVNNCRDPVPLQGGHCDGIAHNAERDSSELDVNHCSCSEKGVKRAWEASTYSLKSKRVKGSHHIDCLDSEWNCASGSNKRTESCFGGCSLDTSISKSLVQVTPKKYLPIMCSEKNVLESRQVTSKSNDQVNKVHLLRNDYFRIMLMNIADDTKKAHLSKIIEDLGGSITSDGSDSTHVITGKVRKTLNFCTALCSGAWILSASWLKESFRYGRFVDETPFILKDEDYALKYKIGLEYAVLKSHANPHALFKGYSVCLAAHVQPHPRTLSPIISSAGGKVIHKLGKEIKEASKTIYVACEEDMEEALSVAKKGISTFSSEWFMSCVMKQELDLDAPQFSESL